MAKRKKGKRCAPKPYKYINLLSDELKKEVTAKPSIISFNKDESEFMRKEYSIRTLPICWGIPMDEILYAKFFSNFLMQAKMPWDSIITTESTYLPSARNTIHNNFLERNTDPYLMMLDSDVLSPPNIVQTLINHDKHIVGGWYRKKSRTDAHPIVYDFIEETEEGIFFEHRKEPGTGLEKVGGMGAGCWLMSRELAEALGENPYSMDRGTEDLVLCKKIMDLGYEMWVDWDMACPHVGVTWV
jgi:hypothetical protein